MIVWMAAAQAACTVVSGEVFDGERFTAADVVAVDGTLVAVEAGARGLSGDAWKGETCTRIAVPEGGVITPGLVDPSAVVGLSEVGLERQTVDLEGQGDPIRAALRVAEAYNPASVYIPIWRKAGITSAIVMPRGGRVSGQAAWVRLAGTTQAEAVLEPVIGVRAGLGGRSKAQALQTLRELIQDARAYDANRGAVQGNRYRSFVDGASRHDLEALVPVARGEVPLIVGADRAADIEAVLRFAREEEVRVVLLGGAEAHVHAAVLAEAEVPVVLTPMVYGPGSFDQIHARPDNAAVLAEAGVTVLLRSAHNYNAPALRFAAGNAVREGMSREAALAAITSAPGVAFGLEPRGRLVEGAPADFVVWTGDPLEIGSFAAAVVVDGAQESTQTRQDALFERYRTLPGSPVPPRAP